MRRFGCAPLFLLLACTPATNGVADGEAGTDEIGDGDGDGDGEPGDGDGEPGDGDGEPGDGDGEPGDGDGEPGDGDGDGDGDGPCTDLGCECDGSPDSCDAPFECLDGFCSESTCGNGEIDGNEQCDDQNEVDGDGCDNDCTHTELLAVVAGGRHSCALIEGGRLRCWGEGIFGSIGYGNTDRIGDNELPHEAGDVALPGPVSAVDLGEGHTCALLEDQELRCWGAGTSGQLGYASTASLGNDEFIDDLGGVVVGGTVAQFSLGGLHTCARLAGDTLRCWGRNNDGQLGIANTKMIGNDETPAESDAVMLGVDAVLVAGGGVHSCAITSADELRCWGKNNNGQLGYGNTDKLGDNEPPSEAGDIDLYSESLPEGATLTQVSLGGEHTCALFSSGDVVCWGNNSHGQLGQVNKDTWGNDALEHPSALMPISLGAPATAISAGFVHTCALLQGGEVRCWGRNDRGQLGLGHTDDIGDDESPDDVGVDPVDLGGAAVGISAGFDHNCALLEDNSIVCWGKNVDGRLGYGNTIDIGNDETPASAGAVSVL